MADAAYGYMAKGERRGGGGINTPGLGGGSMSVVRGFGSGR